jgi:hypothetical protein
MYTLTELNRIREERGVIDLIKCTPPLMYKSIRNYVPSTSREVTFNGVKIANRRLFDGILWSSVYLPPTESKPSYKSPNIESLRDYIEVGDEVCIIGAGLGVTTVAAANQSESGKVHSYEASAQRVADINRVCELNGVSNRCEIKHAIIGDGIDIIGIAASEEVIHPTDLPECDVLELDCEGAEKTILEGLNKRPRTIIVETHPSKGAKTQTIEEILRDKKYEIIERKSDPSDGHVLIAEIK